MTQTIWLHGAGLNKETWVGTPSGLRLDLPGHGQAAAVGDVSVRGYGDALLAQMPARFCIVGHSLGGMVGIDIAARHPERCAALVLVDPPLRIPLGGLPGLSRGLARLLARVPGPGGIGALMALRVERRANRAMVREAIGGMTQTGLRDAMIAAVGFDGHGHLAGLSMPVLVLLGRRSVLTGPRTAAAFRAALPRATIETWDAGHMIPFDLPEAFQARVQAFLSDQQ